MGSRFLRDARRHERSKIAEFLVYGLEILGDAYGIHVSLPVGGAVWGLQTGKN